MPSASASPRRLDARAWLRSGNGDAAPNAFVGGGVCVEGRRRALCLARLWPPARFGQTTSVRVDAGPSPHRPRVPRPQVQQGACQSKKEKSFPFFPCLCLACAAMAGPGAACRRTALLTRSQCPDARHQRSAGEVRAIISTRSPRPNGRGSPSCPGRRKRLLLRCAGASRPAASPPN